MFVHNLLTLFITCKHVMNDLGRIRIPFNEQFCSGEPEENRGLVDLQLCQWNGAKLESGSISYLPDGTLEATDLRHPYESIASSNSTLSFKIYKGGENYWPFVEIKASPAKLLTGHNVYGSCDFEKCLTSICEAFIAGMPDLSNMLDWHFAEIQQIDVTFSARLCNDNVGRQVIAALKNTSSGQTRSSKNSHATTVYWGTNSHGKKSSRHKQLKAYLKYPEVLGQISDLEAKYKRNPLPVYKSQIEKLTNVLDYSKGLLRFEASVLKRMFQRLHIPTLLTEFIDYYKEFESNGKSLCYELWKTAFKDIFDALGDKDMNIFTDEEVHTKLCELFSYETPSGNISFSKADRLFGVFRRFKYEGWEEVRKTMSKATFYRYVDDLSEVVSKAHLQNLHGIGQNVVPMLRVINIDFDKQLPENWQEPLQLSEQMGLRLVS